MSMTKALNLLDYKIYLWDVRYTLASMTFKNLARFVAGSSLRLYSTAGNKRNPSSEKGMRFAFRLPALLVAPSRRLAYYAKWCNSSAKARNSKKIIMYRVACAPPSSLVGAFMPSYRRQIRRVSFSSFFFIPKEFSFASIYCIPIHLTRHIFFFGQNDVITRARLINV